MEKIGQKGRAGVGGYRDSDRIGVILDQSKAS